MQNLRKNKNKVVTTQMMGLSNEEALDRDMNEDMGRGCKTKHSMMQNNNCCQEPCKEAEPCNNNCVDPCKKPQHHHKQDHCCETCEDTISQNCIKILVITHYVVHHLIYQEYQQLIQYHML